MSERISERALVLPALAIIERKPGILTSSLITELMEIFSPQGEDAQILAGRNDTKFSQKVRNLKSHRDFNGMGRWTVYENGTYTLTEAGFRYLAENRAVFDYLCESGFSRDDFIRLANAIGGQIGGRRLLVYTEALMNAPGQLGGAAGAAQKHAALLRETAVSHYAGEDGHIRCSICGFDFLETYGESGRGFIELHHERPLFQHVGEAPEPYIREVLPSLRPICSNCHRMLHRRAGESLSAGQLAEQIRHAGSALCTAGANS